jgi:hypothetical protein
MEVENLRVFGMEWVLCIENYPKCMSTTRSDNAGYLFLCFFYLVFILDTLYSFWTIFQSSSKRHFQLVNAFLYSCFFVTGDSQG